MESTLKVTEDETYKDTQFLINKFQGFLGPPQFIKTEVSLICFKSKGNLAILSKFTSSWVMTMVLEGALQTVSVAILRARLSA